MICNDVSIVNLRSAKKAADVQVNVITIFGNVVVPIRMMQWQTSYHCIHVPQSLGACPAKPYQKPQRPAYLRFHRPLIGTANSEGNLAAAKLLGYINGLPRKTPFKARWHEVSGVPSLFVFVQAAQTPLGLLGDHQKRKAGGITQELLRSGT